MSERHMEENTQYVMENRMADQNETDAIVKALESFGVKDAENYAYHLYGRQDEPYGWYLFGMSPIEEFYGSDQFADGQTEKFIILGDCLDVLEDYNRVLTLKEVHEFAICEMDGRYEAIQKWGVFQSLSMELKNMIADTFGSDMDETVEWDNVRREWKLKFDLEFLTDCGSECHQSVRIPAMFNMKEEADEEFAKEWDAIRRAFSVDDRRREFADNGLSYTEALDWAKSEERKIAEINNAIKTYYGKKHDAAEAAQDLQFKDGQGYVWVLTIMAQGQNFPEVHKTFDGAVASAILDMKEKMEEEEVDEDEYDFDAIKHTLDEQRYWKDDNTDTSYDICECPLCK